MNNYKVTLGLRQRSNERIASGVFVAEDSSKAFEQAKAHHNPFRSAKLKFAVIEKLQTTK